MFGAKTISAVLAVAALGLGVCVVAEPAHATTPVALGPVYPPPGATVTSNGTGAIAPGGITYTYSAFDTTQFSQIAWGLDSVPYVAMEGPPAPSDNLSYNPSLSNLAGGVMVWTGSTSVSGQFYTGSVATELIVTVKGTGSATTPFIAQTALPAPHFDAVLPSSVGSVGAVAPYPSNGSGNFYMTANVQFLAGAGSANQPAQTFYDSVGHDPSLSMYSSVGAGSYYLAPLTINTATLPNAVKGIQYMATLSASGGGSTPDFFSLVSGSLPAGLTLSSGGVISGTPTTLQTSNFTVQVADSSTPQDTATANLSLTVVPIAVSTTTLPGAPVDAAYKTTLGAIGGTKPYAWKLLSGSLPKGIALASTGVLSGTPTVIGTSSFTVKVSDAAKPTPNSATATLSLTVLPMSVATTTLPNAPVGRTYKAMLLTHGGKSTFHWKITTGSLPFGLAMSTAGAITGTPHTVGTSNFMVQVTDSAVPAHTATAAESITVTPLTITTATLPNGKLKTAYSAKLAVSGGQGTLVFSASSGLPPGIKLASTGVFSGTPTTAGTFSFTVSVHDSAKPPNSASKGFTITVS